MVNLLPPTAKKAIKNEYWVRVAGVSFGALSLCLIVVLMLQVPTYVLLTGQLKGYETRYESAQSEQGLLQQAEAEVKLTNQLAKHLDKQDESVLFSEYVTAIESMVGSGIILSHFDSSRASGKVEKIQIRGVAATRSALAQFSDTITNNPLFVEAKVPIANLASEKDIDFEITVIPSKP